MTTDAVAVFSRRAERYKKTLEVQATTNIYL